MHGGASEAGVLVGCLSGERADLAKQQKVRATGWCLNEVGEDDDE